MGDRSTTSVSPPGPLERADDVTDAIWQLMAWSNWFSDFVLSIIHSLLPSTSISTPSNRSLLLVHPYPRALLQRGIKSLVALQSFLTLLSSSPPSNLSHPTPVSYGVLKEILADLLSFGGVNWREFIALMTALNAAAQPDQLGTYSCLL